MSRRRASPDDALPPGSRIGILGGGQLGRMTAMAAARLGYRAHIFCPEADNPASQVAAATVADYDDRSALVAFAKAIDVVTFEFENVPNETLQVLADFVPVRPGSDVLRIAQDRGEEKDFLRRIGIATAPYARIDSIAALDAALAETGRPALLKAARFGYDGKGQRRIAPEDDSSTVWEAFGTNAAVLEGFVDFACEISVIAARGPDGGLATYEAVENVHVRHILDTTRVPARIGPDMASEAESIARRVAEALDLVGLVAVEMFVTRDGRILVNEIAPRPHNSGHWTLDACPTDQFEQLVRAICGLPLGITERHSDAIMTNLIGEEADHWPEILAEPGAILHLYGKTETRPGRKMGHVTRLAPKS
ncbi:MAG: 5-(carboxyamino)imidazole ribonucleotide synthase [Alphaproteobacteria bacterium]